MKRSEEGNATVEELLTERGLEADHTTIWHWL
jgi:transposase-like protein